MEDLAIYTNQTGAVVPPPPPPPPPPRGEVHGDFAWSPGTFGVQFHDRSNAPGTLVSWRWDFGDGYGSRRENPMHDYPCRGNYTVTLYLEDQYGNKGNVSKPVSIGTNSTTCGILAHYEEGLVINVGGTLVTIPQAFFLVMLVVSGATIAMGMEFPLISMRARKLLFVLSVTLTLIAFGALSWIT